MKTLNTQEIETVAGGLPFLAMPAIVVALPVRPKPLPSNEPVTVNGKPAMVSL